MLRAFSHNVFRVLTRRLGRHVLAVRNGLMACRQLGSLDKALVKHTVNLDIGAKLVRHLTCKYISATLEESNTELQIQTCCASTGPRSSVVVAAPASAPALVQKELGCVSHKLGLVLQWLVLAVPDGGSVKPTIPRLVLVHSF